MPWGGGNSGSFGSSLWGNGAVGAPSPAPPTDAVIQEVTVLKSNLLRVDFSVPMKSDGVLSDPSNYTVVPVGGGVPVTPTKVHTPIGPSANYVLLNVTSFSVGEFYLVDIINLRTAAGGVVDVVNSSFRFYGKFTKLDFTQSLQPALYSRGADSVFGTILIAIMSEDEKIGGSGEGNE